jgi:DNA-binding transcriptional ArsR family regulator
VNDHAHAPKRRTTKARPAGPAGNGSKLAAGARSAGSSQPHAPNLHRLKDIKAFSVLIAPIRIEIAEMLRCMGPCTMSQLAQQLARPADTLYRHMRMLEKAGLVTSTTIRQAGKRSEAMYQFVADDITLGFPPDRKGQAALLGMSNNFFRAATKAIKDSAGAQRLRFGDLPPGVAPNLSILYELGWLTPDGVRRARALLAELKQLLDEGKRSGQGELFLSVAALTPVTRTHTRGGKPAMATQRTPRRGTARDGQRDTQRETQRESPRDSQRDV